MQAVTPERSASLKEYQRTPEGGVFDRTRRTLHGLIGNIRTGRDVEESKRVAGDLLEARDRYYLDLIRIVNPSTHLEEYKGHIYRAPDLNLYGSLPALLDANPALSAHRQIATVLASSSDIPMLEGEAVEPRSLFEAHVGFGGSMAEARINKFPTDLDLHEYMRIHPPEGKTTYEVLAGVLQANASSVASVHIDGKRADIHYNFLRLNPIPDMHPSENPRWSYEEIRKGEKTYRTSEGSKNVVSLADALRHSNDFLASYYCVTDDSVFAISKKIFVEEEKNGVVKKLTPQRNDASFHEVYFQDPSDFPLVEKAYDIDSLNQYLGAMEGEIGKNLHPDHMNVLKALRRFYNWNKALGDIALAEEVAPFFSTGAVYAYQLSSRLDILHYVKGLGVDVSKQEHKMKSLLIRLLSQSKNSLAKNIVYDLLEHTEGRSYMDIHADVLKFVNGCGIAFVQQHPDLRRALLEIRDTGKRGGYHG